MKTNYLYFIGSSKTRSPPSQAFGTAAVPGMGWGLHPQALIEAQLADGSLVERVPGQPLDVPICWQTVRAASGLLDGLSRQMLAAARDTLLPLSSPKPHPERPTDPLISRLP